MQILLTFFRRKSLQHSLKFMTILFAFLFLSSSLYSQPLTYQFAATSGTYTPLTGGTQFATWTGTGDEGYSVATDIGFSFTYAGTAFTQFQASTNGFLRMGTGLASATTTNLLAGITRNIIAPLWDDLKVDTVLSITYNLSGAEPNRVLTVEWKDVKWNYAAPTANANFQVKLYETTNKIEFVYGTSALANVPSASIGLSNGTAISSAGQATGTFLSINLAGVVGDRKYHQSMGYEFNWNQVAPDPNSVFTFTPFTPSPIAGGTYTIGGSSPTYPTLSEAAMALNMNGISGPVSLEVRAGIYDDVFYLINVAGTSSTNTITIKNATGATVTLSPKNGNWSTTAPSATAGDAMIRLDGTQYVTVDGLRLVDNVANNTTRLKFNMGVLLANSAVTTAVLSVKSGARFNTLKNLFIDLRGDISPENAGSIGIRFGTNGTSTDTSQANSYNTIQDVNIKGFWRSAIFMYGFTGNINPDRGNRITAVTGRNDLGNVNIIAGTGADIRVIEMYTQKDLLIEKTDIRDVNCSILTTNGIWGIRLSPANSATDYLSGNVVINDVNIYNLENSGLVATTGWACGIEGNRQEAGSSLTISNTKIYDIYSNANSTGRAIGIYTNLAASTGTVTGNIYNNYIVDIRAPRSTASTTTTGPGAQGMNLQAVAGGTLNPYKVYYNTVVLDDAVPPTIPSHYSTNLFWGNFGTGSMDLRNNIFVNTMSTGTASTGRAQNVFASANSNLLRLAPTSNNNSYYTGVNSAVRPVAFDGTTAFQTLANYQTAVSVGGLGGPRELNSVLENPPFIAAASPYNLHINTTVATQLEFGGTPISGITTDFDGNLRNANFPDIGAEEFTGIDGGAPKISYTPLLNTGATTARTLVVTVTDGSGVPVTAPGWPNLYWKKTGDANWTAVTPASVSGNNYSYTIGAGVVAGDVVSYYVVAQDLVSTPNVGAFPLGASGFTINPPAAATAPTTPSSYVITAAPLAGVYSVGLTLFNQISGRNISFVQTIEKVQKEVIVEKEANNKPVDKNSPVENLSETSSSQVSGETKIVEVEEIRWIPMENGKNYNGPLFIKKNENPSLNFPEGIEGVYATITAAIADLNLRSVSGATTFSLVDATYPTETFPIAINITNEILPTSTNNITIKPAAGITATISGAAANSRIFTILNSFVTIDGSNTVGGTTRDLTIENTSATAPQVLVVGSKGTTPITNVTIKNSNLINGINSSSAVVVSDGSTPGTAGWFNNITLQNNSVQKAYIAFYCIANVVAGNGSGLSINNNNIDASGANAVRIAGIYVQGVDGATVTNNTIANLTTIAAEIIRGIWLATGTSNSNVTDNSVSNLFANNVGSATALGIVVSTGVVNANINISDNTVTGLTTPGTGTTSGIYVFSTTENVTVSNNVVSNIKNTNATGWGSNGIYLASTSLVANITAFNNIISDITAYGYAGQGAGDNGYGIVVGAGAGYKVYYNSVNLFTNQTAVTGCPAAFNVITGLAANAVDVRNNIFANAQTSGDNRYSIINSSAANVFSSINYNDYFTSGTNLGYFNGNPVLDLNAWQTLVLQDANSKSVNPQYTDTLNLRPLLGSQVYASGTPLAGITTDFMGKTRNATTPSMGAYEYPDAVIGWANLQWPPSPQIIAQGEQIAVYAQAWMNGLSSNPGQTPGLECWIGISSTNTNPDTWTIWVPATFNVQSGNNDEFMANIGSTLTPGTYYYAARWQYAGGAYLYGGFNSTGGGFWDGTNNVSCQLAIYSASMYNTIWQRSLATSTLPSWFGLHTERGLAYGNTIVGIEGNDRIYVVSRNGGTYVKILDATNGNDLGNLNTTGVSGGTYTLNDIEVTADGKILSANLTTNITTSPFKVYVWNTESAIPVVAINYTGTDAVRLGDKFTVVGDYSLGTAVLYAASATSGFMKVYKFTMTAGVFNQVPEVIALSDNATGTPSSASIAPMPNGDFYWKATGFSVKKYTGAGVLLGTIPGTIVASGANAIRYIGTLIDKEYIIIYQYGAGNENARIVQVPVGDVASATTFDITPTLGNASNINGSGDVSFKENHDGSIDIVVMGTNNGIGLYRTIAPVPVELTSFAAAQQNNDVILSWSTATETNSKEFRIERKSENNWTVVGSVEAAGTSTEVKSYNFTDKDVATGKLSYRLKVVDIDGTFGYSKEINVEMGVPTTFRISQNYPNPFNPTTRIDYQLPSDANVTIELYDVTGQKVAMMLNQDMSAGYHSFDLEAGRYGMATGVYIYRIVAIDKASGQTFVDSKKLMMLK